MIPTIEFSLDQKRWISLAESEEKKLLGIFQLLFRQAFGSTSTLDFLWVAGTPTTNEQFDSNSVFCVNEPLDTLPHSSLLKNITLTLQLPDQICNSPYCQP